MSEIENEVIKDTKPFVTKQGVKTTLVVVATLLIAYGMANLEVIRRARASYLRGEEHFKQQKYKEAMWDYQEVQEFYYLPHTHYVDMASEKEWICRAYLGDFVPPEGPLDADIRTMTERNGKPNDYSKYQAEIATITPVGDISYQPAPPTTYEKEKLAKEKKKKK